MHVICLEMGVFTLPPGLFVYILNLDVLSWTKAAEGLGLYWVCIAKQRTGLHQFRFQGVVS